MPMADTHALFSRRFGHARGKTTLSCFLTLSRRFATSVEVTLFLREFRLYEL